MLAGGFLVVRGKTDLSSRKIDLAPLTVRAGCVLFARRRYFFNANLTVVRTMLPNVLAHVGFLKSGLFTLALSFLTCRFLRFTLARGRLVERHQRNTLACGQLDQRFIRGLATAVLELTHRRKPE